MQLSFLIASVKSEIYRQFCLKFLLFFFKKKKWSSDMEAEIESSPILHQLYRQYPGADFSGWNHPYEKNFPSVLLSLKELCNILVQITNNTTNWNVSDNYRNAIAWGMYFEKVWFDEFQSEVLKFKKLVSMNTDESQFDLIEEWLKIITKTFLDLKHDLHITQLEVVRHLMYKLFLTKSFLSRDLLYLV